jgi:transposase InsO family protein
MNVHKNARMTPRGRAHLLKEVAVRGLTPAAAAAGVSPRTAAKWRQRERQYGPGGLLDRSSRPWHSPQRVPADKAQRAVRLRQNHRLTYQAIGARLGLSVATVGRLCQAAGCNRLPPLQASPPARRYERTWPGEMIHLDTKKLARFDRPGHRVTGDRTRGSTGAGYQALHVAIDDRSRVGFGLLLADETSRSALAFLFAALRYYRALGVRVVRVMTDNGSAYRCRTFAKALRRLHIRHVFTRPYTPRTNGKAERFIQTLLREWAYAHPYPNHQVRAAELPYWLHHYNFHRPHTAVDGLPPISRLPFGSAVNNVVRNYT